MKCQFLKFPIKSISNFFCEMLLSSRILFKHNAIRNLFQRTSMMERSFSLNSNQTKLNSKSNLTINNSLNDGRFSSSRKQSNSTLLFSNEKTDNNDNQTTIIKKQTLTSTMQQYVDLKKQYPQYLLLFRIGDFYELFFEDAVLASKELDIRLTSKNKSENSETLPIPMAGVPAHALNNYVHRLIEKGFTVAICDQLETAEEAKKQKRTIRREITRLVTPGTILEEDVLKASEPNYLASIVGDKTKTENLAVAWTDISTGEIFVSSTQAQLLPSIMSRINASEMLIESHLMETHRNNLKGYYLSKSNENVAPNVEQCKELLLRCYDKQTVDSLKYSDLEFQAIGMLLKFLFQTQMGKPIHLKSIGNLTKQSVMTIDSITRKSLEILETQKGERNGSLVSVIDKTLTNMGARLLLNYLNAPSLSLDIINERLDFVQFFFDRPFFLKSIRDQLKEIADVERALQRLFLKRGSPQDLVIVGETIETASRLFELISMELQHSKSQNEGKLSERENRISRFVSTFQQNFEILKQISKVLKQYLVDEPPIFASDGNFIRAGISKELDEERQLRDNAHSFISKLQSEYRETTKISTLKIKQSQLLGFFIEFGSKKDATTIPKEFQPYQTSQSFLRYKSEKLSELERQINGAASNSLQIELKLFQSLTDQVLKISENLNSLANSLSFLDVICSFSKVSLDRNYKRPKVTNNLEFEIIDGRHPCVEANHMDDGFPQLFVGNDCVLPENANVWLVTGANMGGKSTFLRQNALISIMAQIGCFVPAKSATIGLVDGVFTRIGSGDELTRDRSTFMVEMLETARIIHGSTERSLIILDEVGRGTSTYDGLSIAWSVLEYLHNTKRCRTLFATHFHELAKLESSLNRLRCKQMVVGSGKDLVFLYKVGDGVSHQSFGIHVAKLAGLPLEVISRANQVLESLLNK